MYQCTLRIRICGADAELENILRSVPPRERFEHVFVSGGPGPDRRDLEQDDVIFLQAGRFPACPKYAARPKRARALSFWSLIRRKPPGCRTASGTISTISGPGRAARRRLPPFRKAA